MSARWDSGFKGANVTLSGGSLVAVAAGLQCWVRCTLGRNPAADATPRQWTITVPANTGAGSEHYRPGFGMADEDRIYADGLWGYSSIHGWSFGFGVQFIENDYYYHNGTTSSNWDSGSNGGVPFVLDFIWFPQAVGGHSAGDLDVYKNGVFSSTVPGVTSGAGKLMYPCFGTGSAGGPGTFPDQGTANFGATAFTYPDPGGDGALAWAPLVVPVPDFSAPVVSGTAPLIVNFANESTGADSYLWAFGDADTSTETNPVHAFHEAGTYTVALTATNTDGSATETKVAYITVTDAPPITSDDRHPRIGYRCIALDNADAVVSSDSIATGYAAANLFDWKPYTYWKPAAGGEHYVQIVLPEAEIADYIAIAQHNLGENAGTFRLAYSNDSGGSWSDAIANYSPSGRESIWLDFDAISANYWRVYTNSVTASVLGVVAFGRKYRPRYGQFAGFKPPKLARSFDLYASTSEAGLFLGRTILRKKLKGAISFDMIELADAYGDWHPFMQAAEQHPFFLAWLLEDWPEDVQLVATAGDWSPPAITQFGFVGTTVNWVGLLQE